jgi:hypothetical protein
MFSKLFLRLRLSPPESCALSSHLSATLQKYSHDFDHSVPHIWSSTAVRVAACFHFLLSTAYIGNFPPPRSAHLAQFNASFLDNESQSFPVIHASFALHPWPRPFHIVLPSFPRQLYSASLRMSCFLLAIASCSLPIVGNTQSPVWIASVCNEAVIPRRCRRFPSLAGRLVAIALGGRGAAARADAVGRHRCILPP